MYNLPGVSTTQQMLQQQNCTSLGHSLSTDTTNSEITQLSVNLQIVS